MAARTAAAAAGGCRLGLLLAVAWAGCGGDGGPTVLDAAAGTDGSTSDASGQVGDAGVDGGSAPVDAGGFDAPTASPDAGPSVFTLRAYTEPDPTGVIRLRSNLPAEVGACLAVPMREVPCGDGDGDGLVDAWEDVVLDHLRPLVRLDEDEPLVDDAMATVGHVGRVHPVVGGHYRVFLMLGYGQDYGRCGLTGHNGDSERIVLDLEAFAAGDGGDVRLSGLYTASHEGTANDHSQIFRGDALSMLERGVDPTSGEVRLLVFVSEGKHATYATNAICEGVSSVPCLQEDCEADGVLDASRYQILMPYVNAGEPTSPLVTDLASLGFIGDDAWAEQPFCGGRDRGSCAAPVREKLLLDPFE